ncbi:MAG: permease [Pseudonocardiales bacterium]
MGIATTVWDSLTEGFFMFWETLWALILGFTLSGAVQAFVSKEEMHRSLGDRRPRTLVRSSLLGAASSSCSYAASALAKSLFARGADFTSSMVFMFASTNLVVELGIVLWLLIGWQFALAEFVGGTIMIVLFALLAPRIFPAAELQAARQRLAAATDRGGHDGHGDAGSGAAWQGKPLLQRLRSKAGWADAAGYTVADLTMLRRELIVGYLVAGVLAVAVPPAAYSAVFISGHGIWTDLENVIVGPFIAFISFVCSIGNVPLAAALYKGGISFGGTVAFIFADLIALPLVVIYGKFYGRRLAVRLFVSFWLVMSAAGLAVDLLFGVIGIDFPQRPQQIAPTRFAWDYTTYLNIVFFFVAGAVYWTYRNRDRLGGGQDYARDPVCGMQVEIGNAPASTAVHGRRYYFCCDRCRDRFAKEQARFADQATLGSTGADRP